MALLAPPQARTRRLAVLRQAGWWSFFAVCVVYASYALGLAIAEVASWIGVGIQAKPRAVPVVFVPHAVAGAVALIVAPLQLNSRLRARHRQVHRAMGRVYVGAAWAASMGGLWSAVYFDVRTASRLLFAAAAVLWFLATTRAYVLIRRGVVARHREWMIRSFAVALFFVTFEFWIGGLEAIGLSPSTAHPLGVFLGWSVNVAVAEGWIRRTRRS